MPWFESPSAIRPSTSRSRGVSSVERVVLAPAADELRDHGRVDGRAAAADAPHGIEEVVDLGDAVLEQVAEALGVLREERERMRRLDHL